MVRYTGAAGIDAGTTLTVGSTSYQFVEAIAANTVAFEVVGFSATVSDFVTLSGNFGFAKQGTDIVAVGSSVGASLTAGAAVSVSLTGAKFGLRATNTTTAF